MIGRGWAALGVAVLVIGLGGCAQVVAVPGDGAAARAQSGEPRGSYLSTEVTEDGEPRELVPGTRVALSFEDDRIRASAGCNTMSGPVRFDDGRMYVDDLAMTEMGCPGDGRHEQDRFVADFLGSDPTYDFDGSSLDLRSGGVRIVLGPREQVEPDLPLEGTRWEVTHLTQGPPKDAPDDPDAPVSAGTAPEGAHLQFADGRVTGSDGCNALSGNAIIDGETIAFGSIASTKRACPGVQGSADMLAVLDGVVDWRIDTTVLHLEHPSGKGLQLQGARGPVEHDPAHDTSQDLAECQGADCYELDLKPDECVRSGEIVTVPGRGGVSKGTISDYGSETVGAPTAAEALDRHRFSRAKPRATFTYELYAERPDRVVAHRLVGERVVATAGINRTARGGWVIGGTTERDC